MTNFEFLQKYQKLQLIITFDHVVDLGFALISYSDIKKTASWNWALVNKLISDDELLKIEESFKSFKRNPSFYFENREDLKPLIDYLLTKDYEKDYEDSWMFWQDDKIDIARFNEIKKVENEDDLKIYLRTYDDSYQKDDPQN